MPDAKVAGLGFDPWSGHLGGGHRETAKLKDSPRTLLPISLWWLECVDEDLLVGPSGVSKVW
jgi:hypothetical protein